MYLLWIDHKIHIKRTITVFFLHVLFMLDDITLRRKKLWLNCNRTKTRFSFYAQIGQKAWDQIPTASVIFTVAPFLVFLDVSHLPARRNLEEVRDWKRRGWKEHCWLKVARCHWSFASTRPFLCMFRWISAGRNPVQILSSSFSELSRRWVAFVHVRDEIHFCWWPWIISPLPHLHGILLKRTRA